jgi:HAD superfamily hydrolase (TIGR01509 family)
VTVVDAVIFDLDGVIVDSEPVWEEVRRAYVADHGGTWQPDSQQRLMGMSTGEWARYLSDELGVDRPAERVATEVVDEMVARYEKSFPLIPGADEAVRRIGARWPLGLASSSPQRLIGPALESAGLTALFRAALSTERVPRGKPAPDVWLEVARMLGVQPGRAVAVEDSSNGVRSAHAAGLTVIAIPHERYPLDADAAGRPAVTLRHVTDLTPDVVENAVATG